MHNLGCVFNSFISLLTLHIPHYSHILSETKKGGVISCFLILRISCALSLLFSWALWKREKEFLAFLFIRDEIRVVWFRMKECSGRWRSAYAASTSAWNLHKAFHCVVLLENQRVYKAFWRVCIYTYISTIVSFVCVNWPIAISVVTKAVCSINSVHVVKTVQWTLVAVCNLKSVRVVKAVQGTLVTVCGLNSEHYENAVQ